MLRARVAELVLTVAVGAERASEITGDLLEQGAQVRFWWAVLGIVARASWRWAAAIASAAVLSMMLLTRYVFATQMQADERMEPTWGVLCMLAGLCVLTVVVLNAFRFGVRNRVNAAGLPLALLLMVTACVASNEPWLRVGVGLSVLYLVACLLASGTRRAMLCVVAPAAAYALSFWGLLHLMSAADAVPQGVLAGEFFGLWFASFVCEARLLVVTRRLLLVG